MCKENKTNWRSYATKCFALGNDIILTGENNYFPAGIYDSSQSVGFSGTFDGRNHCIEGIYLNLSDYKRVSFIGAVYTGAVIKNLTLKNCTFINGINRDGACCAAIVAETGNSLTIQECKVENCTISCTSSDNACYVGGIIGHDDVKINNEKITVKGCEVKGNTTISAGNGSSSVGAVVGRIYNITANLTTYTSTWSNNIYKYTVTRVLAGEEYNGNGWGIGNDVGGCDVAGKVETDVMPVSATATNYEGEYDGNGHGIAFTSLETGATVLYGTSESEITSAENPTYTDVGTHTVYYKVSKTGCIDLIGSKTVKITAKAITITAKDQTITYGGIISSGADQATASSLVSGDALSSITLSKNQTNAGTYNNEITVSNAVIKNGNTDKTSNYSISYAKGKLTINKATLSLSWTNTELTYNGEKQTPTVTATGLVGSDACTITVSGGQTNAGTYTATAESLSNSNYKLPDAKTKSFTIAKATPVVGDFEIEDLSTSKDYNEQPQGVSTPTLKSPKTGAGTITVKYKKGSADATTTAPTNAGTYTVTFDVAGGDNFNAATGLSIGTLTINKVYPSLSYSLSSGLEYNGSEQQLLSASASAGKLMYSVDRGAYSTTPPTGRNAKTYGIEFYAKGDDNHYDSSIRSENVTIAKKALTITANPKTITYGDTPANDGVTYSGFVEGETSEVLTGAISYGYNYTQYGNKGDYAITPSGQSSTNYDINYVNGTLTVVPKEVTLNWSNTSFVYDGSSHAPTATATGLVNNNVCTVTVSGGQSNAGDYTATASALSNANYALPTDKTKEFKINPYNISTGTLDIISIGNQTYTGSAITPTTTVKATNIGQAVTADYSYSANTNVGTVNITLEGTGNYTGTKTNATSFTIVPKPLENSMIASISHQTYTGSAIHPPLTVTYNSMSLTKDNEYSVEYSNNTSAGTATATITANNTNYSGTATANFTIDQADLSAATVTAADVTADFGTEVSIGTLTASLPSTDYDIVYRKTYQTGEDVSTIPTNKIGTYTVVLKGKGSNVTGEKVTSYTVNVQLPVSLKQCEWTTYYDERFDLATPEGYQAYKVTTASTAGVTAEAIDYIPKGVPVILKTTTTGISDNTMTIKLNEQTALSSISGDGAFLGVPSTSEGVNAAAGKAFYILVGDKFVLYEGTGTIPKHRCYLSFNTPAASRGIDITFGEGETTGIDDMPPATASDGQDRWFDMQGRRIDTPTRQGIYIKNGNKVVITGKEAIR